MSGAVSVSLIAGLRARTKESTHRLGWHPARKHPVTSQATAAASRSIPSAPFVLLRLILRRTPEAGGHSDTILSPTYALTQHFLYVRFPHFAGKYVSSLDLRLAQR